MTNGCGLHVSSRQEPLLPKPAKRKNLDQRFSGETCPNGKTRDVVQVRKPPVTYSFKVLQAIEKRVGAKLVPEIMENVTTPDQYELLEMSKISGFVDRARGTGRPTKKERRDLDEFFMPEYLDDFDFDFDDEEEDEE